MTKEEQLKIYAAYMPYGLEGQLKYDIKEDFQDDDWLEDLSIFEKGAIWKLAGYADQDLSIPMGEGEFSGWLWRNKNTYAGIDESIKPILYPLEYLTKEIEHDGRSVCFLMEIYKKHPFNCTYQEMAEHIKTMNIDLTPFWLLKELLKYHFNVFNLPEDKFINKATLTNIN